MGTTRVLDPDEVAEVVGRIRIYADLAAHPGNTPAERERFAGLLHAAAAGWQRLPRGAAGDLA